LLSEERATFAANDGANIGGVKVQVGRYQRRKWKTNQRGGIPKARNSEDWDLTTKRGWFVDEIWLSCWRVAACVRFR
jgi:hypothetical protein